MRWRMALPLLVTAAIVFLFLSVRTQRCESVETVEFSSDVTYLEALVRLGSKASLESLVAAGGVEVTEREWDGFELGRVHKFSSLEACGRGRFKAKSLSGDFPGEMSFVQSMHASRGGIEVKSEMPRPCGHIKSHVTEIRVLNSRPLVVRVENRLVYERPLPFWLSERMRSHVCKYNKSRTEAIADAIGSILEHQSAKTEHQ